MTVASGKRQGTEGLFLSSAQSIETTRSKLKKKKNIYIYNDLWIIKNCGKI